MPGTPVVLLMAFTLQPLTVPVLVRGALAGGGGVTAVLLGTRPRRVPPCASLPLAQSRLDEGRLVFLPRYWRWVSQYCWR